MYWYEERKKKIYEEQIRTYNKIHEDIISSGQSWATINFRHKDSKYVNFLKLLCNQIKALNLATDDKNVLQKLVANSLIVIKTGSLPHSIINRFKILLYIDWKNNFPVRIHNSEILTHEQACEVLRVMANKLLQDCFGKPDGNEVYNNTAVNFQNDDSFAKEDVKLGSQWLDLVVSNLGKHICRFCGKPAIHDTDVCRDCDPE